MVKTEPQLNLGPLKFCVPFALKKMRVFFAWSIGYSIFALPKASDSQRNLDIPRSLV